MMADGKSKRGKPQAVAERPTSMPSAEDRTIIRPAEEGAEDATPAKPQYQPPYVVVVEGPRTGARFPLSDGPNIVGRAPGNAVRLEDQSVSRQHSEITRGASGWSVRDLGSKNGTFVNGKPITDSVVIGHKDVVKTGIYQMRLITQPIRLEEEMTLPPEIAMADRTVFVAAPPDGLTSEVQRKEVAQERPEIPSDEEQREISRFEQMEVLPEGPAKSRRKLVLFGSLMIVALLFTGWYLKRTVFKPHAPKGRLTRQVVPKPKTPPVEQPQTAGQQTPATQGGDVGQPPASAPPTSQTPDTQGQPPTAGAQTAPAAPPTPPAVQTIPVFLDFASSPLPAKVSFQDKEVGTTPLRVNVELPPGVPQQAQATFSMPEINQQYVQKFDFTVKKDESVVPILFRAPIGMLKVMDLPRDAQFYLEGKFSYDKFQEQTAKLGEIILQKPIYVPFGSYILELRRARQLGQSSPTFVTDIVFRREFTIAEDNPTYQLEVKDDDLKIFPVKIKSDPQGADVFIDGKVVGKTPFEGTFPLGEHKLTLRKEGYFEHAEDLKVDINTPFVGDVKLKTSVAGAHINNARQAMNRQMYQEGINELAEALNSGPAPIEVALANVMLGMCYLRLNDVPRAMGYFEQAKGTETQRSQAMLGLATGYAIQNRLDQALPLLVEVMLRATDEETKRGAHELFQKISPFRSVLYVYSEPPGATVIVNDKPVAQPTPVILHELPLGSYRLRIEKAGYQPTDLNLSLSVNEFNPVVVRLRPIQP